MDAANCIDPAEIQSEYDRALHALRGDLHVCVVDVIAAGSTRTEAAPKINAGPTTAQLSVQRPGPGATAVIAGIRSVEELERITPEGLMARLIARAIGSFVQPADTRADEAADARSQPERLLRVVLGETYETDGLAHVVYRRLLQRGERTDLLDPIRVISLHRTPSGWRAPGPAYEHVRPTSPTARGFAAVLRRGTCRYESAWL